MFGDGGKVAGGSVGGGVVACGVGPEFCKPADIDRGKADGGVGLSAVAQMERSFLYC